MEQTAENIYLDYKRNLEDEWQVLKKKQSRFGWLRLCIVLLAGILAFYFFSFFLLFGWIAIVLGMAFFLWVVSLDADNNKSISRLKILIDINRDEIDLLNDQYAHRYHGVEHLPSIHAYANDLDIFGPNSVYQYLNRCNSEQGKKLLANNLLNPVSVAVIEERHAAIKELAPLYQWRQELQAFSMQSAIRINTQKSIETWLHKEEEAFTHPAWRWIVTLYSCVTILSLLATVFDFMHISIFTFLFLVYFIGSGSLSKKAMQAYNHLNGIVAETDTLFQLMRWIESKKFSSPLLQHLQESVKPDGKYAYQQIGSLKELLNRFDLRLNILIFIILNSFVLWDVRQMIALNKWRNNNRQKLSNWYNLIAEFEVLNSLAALHFNQPGWAFPQFSSKHFTFKALAIGHPLIKHSRRVSSDFNTEGVAKIALVTGSNMAGKSTFLRSLGVNIILAQAGAPVCAKEVSLSPVQVISSMRIADNLAENTSTFYAELKKLKTIIEAVNRHEQVFVLLDEILRGTNSLDRHTGSKALIRQFIKENAVAVIATHDVALSKLEEEYPDSIHNYHFDVQVEGEELYFDYKLKEGVCTSLNASILMKKIGIEMSSS